MLSVKDSAKEGVKSLKKIFAKEGWDLPDVDLTDKQAAVDYLKKKAAQGESFIVVGRCAEGIFEGHPGLISIFILGNKEDKCKRVMELYHLSEQAALEKMRRHDEYRKRYHNNFCEDKWGDSRTYDLCINSSLKGLEVTTDVLESYIRTRMV